MRSVIALSAAAFASLSAAQATSQNNYPYTIDPNSVSTSDRGVYRRLPPGISKADTFRHLVFKPKGPMSSHLPATTRRHHHDH